ncbi:UDP-2,4-diacetamido-2,4,6-trideoxy-beta-L-altropyranose hydrolase [Pigmentibacter ruber]|uniref:UDP-2,4-diacetamido-2,4, 6-trideoxy-beta-L-altropyranose hydrolase n=1 Tax=Pigmentibacter ruber TaxID=2683196 RepID=UPI00131E28F4|nr:UDP-2,4-diacetamido-2,4,6-trideoxy-beta-L-altropyranose hydrolase [Pigmentibacter ruber]
MTLKIVIRVDGSDTIGSGHFARCLVLANEFRNKGCSVEFISFKHKNNLNFLPSDASFKVHNIQSNDNIWNWKEDINWIKSNFLNLTYDLLIIDHYGIDIKWEDNVKFLAKKIFVIDDLADRQHICDYLLDQNLVENFETRYKNIIPNYAMQFLGPKFALLRDEFLSSNIEIKRERNIVKNILITFGGGDASFVIIKVLKALNELNYAIDRINLVISKNTSNLDNIKNLCKFNTELHIDCKNISSLMQEADLCIGAGGITNWERCYLSLPSVIISLADNQVPIAQYLNAKGIVKYLGSAYSITEIEIIKCLAEIFSSDCILSKMSLNASKVINPKNFLGSRFICDKILETI